MQNEPIPQEIGLFVLCYGSPSEIFPSQRKRANHLLRFKMTAWVPLRHFMGCAPLSTQPVRSRCSWNLDYTCIRGYNSFIRHSEVL